MTIGYFEGVLLCLLLAGCRPQQPDLPRVNFSHLDHLTENITLEDKTVSVVHIYSNYPDYGWVDAKESGPEGIACVDDAARAAVVFLRDYELNNHKGSLDRARGLLDFVLAMQAPDGQFWNFINQDHSINRDGKTSLKSFGWWAARGVWSLGLGCRVFRGVDTAYAARLGKAVERTFPYVDSLLRNLGKSKRTGEFPVPTWLLYESGADATSELLVGLTEYYQVAPTPWLRSAIHNLAEGMMVMQDGDIRTAPYGLHRSWSTLWHMWGNGQTMALAMAGRAIGDSVLVQSACREADGFYTRLLIQGFKKEMDLSKPGSQVEYEQIAYGVRPMVLGLLRLYDVTHKTEYLFLAGLSASWLLGNNTPGMALYDGATGRCYDGLRNATDLNRNSGAESTIEALMTFIELEQYPRALRYSTFRKVQSDSLSARFTSPGGEAVTVEIDPDRSTFAVRRIKE
jgi:hypothetical protein